MASADLARYCELAWAAGLYEGEGSLAAVQRAPAKQTPWTNRNLSLRLQTCDHDVLLRFHEVVGGRGVINGPYKKAGVDHKPFWRWSCQVEADVIEILRSFWPWLGERRREQVWTKIGDRGIPISRIEFAKRCQEGQNRRYANV